MFNFHIAHGILKEIAPKEKQRVSVSSNNQTRVYCIAGRFFTVLATREAPQATK